MAKLTLDAATTIFDATLANCAGPGLKPLTVATAGIKEAGLTADTA